MPQCVSCGAELEPPVRVPHTVYHQKLYRIGGEHYCRHHVIRAAVAADLIAEVTAGRDRRPGVILAEGDQPVQG